MFRICAAMLSAVIGVGGGAALGSISYGDIEHWVGDGANQAVLVIDWNDGIAPVSLAWGYRWDGTATGLDMISAVVAADARLYQMPGGGGPDSVYGLGYDLDNDGFSYIPGGGDTGAAGDPDDHYVEGWLTAGFWSYWLSDPLDDPYGTGTWDSALTGPADRLLEDGDWDGWSWAPAWVGDAPDEPIPAPVPSPGAVVMLSSMILFRRPRARPATTG